MKASLELADRRRSFQPNAWQAEPTPAFQRTGFQETSWQEDPHSGTFQDSAFQDEAFQVTEDAFQEFAWQGTAFQIELEPAPGAVAEPVVQPLVKSRQRSDRFYRARQHRQARIVRAPQPAPVVTAVPRPAVLVREDRRVQVAARRRRKPIILRSRVSDSARAHVPVHERSRNPLLRRRRRSPSFLRAPVAVTPPKNRLSVHERSRTRLRRRKPTVFRAPLVAVTGRAVSQHKASRSALVKRTRRARPILLRGVSIPTPAPSTGIPVKRIFVYEDRRAAYVKARRRSKQILRARSVPTAVPLVRAHVFVSKRRLPQQVRARHKPKLLRVLVAPTRPVQLVRQQRRRVQQKRRRAIIVRSLPLWQRPKTPLVVGRRRRASLFARARRRLRLLHSSGLPTPPSTASAYGGILLNDLPLYELGLVDLSLYELSLKDGELYATAVDDLVSYDAAVKDSSLYETSLSDIPGG